MKKTKLFIHEKKRESFTYSYHISFMALWCSLFILFSSHHPLCKAELVRANNRQRTEKTISFRYIDEELVNIVNFLAAQKECNILLPQGADTITNRITLSIDEKLTLDQAWKLLNVILNMANYSIFPKGDMFVVKKKSPTISREPGKLYVGTKPEELPNTEEQIQYIYFLANAKASDDANNDLNKLLAELLPKDSYKVDQATNGIIFSTKANLIRSIMKIVTELDKAGFAEKLAVIRLHHANAELIAKLFLENILKTAEGLERYRLDAKKQSDATYFSKNVKIIPDARTNSLIILGKPQAVERVQEFIFKYIDVELDSGSSILHIYQLQYLEAEKAREVLQQIIDSAKATTGQTKGSPLSQTGTQRTFGEVIIRTDKETVGRKGSDSSFGGNKILFACSKKDWLEMEKLLGKLDQPQPQVLLEVIIADLSVNDIKRLGTSLRNPAKISLPGDMNLQSGMAPSGQGIITEPTFADPKTINADLLSTLGGTKSQASASAPGSTVLSINDNDGRTWCFAEILKSIDSSKILSAPHVLASNNQEALVLIGEQRNLRDDAVGSAGSNTVRRKWVPAFLNVKITPRISSEAHNVTMHVDVHIDQYLGRSSDNRLTRQVTTTATVQDKNILAIGGLLRNDEIESMQKTPILGDIPLLGWFFKGRRSTIQKQNLTVFIQPIIIHPHLRAGVAPETQKYIDLAAISERETHLFDSLKDPVTRIFFESDAISSKEETEKFIRKSQIQVTRPPIAKNKKQNIKKQKLAVAQLPETTEKKTAHKVPLIDKNSLEKTIAKNHPDKEETTVALDSIESIHEKIKNERNPLLCL